MINQIRFRAKVAEITIEDYDKGSLRDFILEERGRELYCEGQRRQDLIRHGKYITFAQQQGFTAAESKHIIYPIPQDAIDENKLIVQNPDY